MKSTLATALAGLLLAGAAVPAQAATDIILDPLTGAEYDTAGVFVTGDISFTGTVDDGGGFDQVLLELWDDNTLKFDQIFSILVGSSGSFHFEASWAGLVGTSAPGIGVYVLDGGQNAIVIDPFNLPHYADPSQCTTNCGPVGAVPEPGTWAMMLMGFAATGLALRRRRRKLPKLQLA